MYILVRLVLNLLLRQRWGPYLLATGIIILGLIVGFSSHQVVYQQADHVTISHYLSGAGDGKAYIETSSGSLYVLTETDFTPALSSDALQSNTATLVYDPQDTESIDVSATNTGAQLNGTGATVVELISYNTNGGSKTFASAEYTQHPQGLYTNNWGGGAGVILAGIALAALFFFMRKYSKKKHPEAYGANGISITPASVRPSGFQQQAGYVAPYPQAPFPQTPYPPQPPYQQAPFPQAPYPQAPYPSQPPYPPQPPYPQAPYPQPAPGPGAVPAWPDPYAAPPGAPPSGPSWSAPTQYAPPPYRQP